MKHLLFASLLLSSTVLWAQDKISTDQGELTINPVLHSTMVLEWDGMTIYIDPYGGQASFSEYDTPDLVLITDIHGDHMNAETLSALDLSNTELIAPQAVIDELGDIKFKKTHALANGEETDWKSIGVEAVPMYNLPETDDSRHPKGRGNGYILTLGGKRVYISGDTEDTPEMRALENVDVAFVCMNQPYTMDVEQAADAVLEFKPAIVYPFHFRGGGGQFSDVEEFKKLVNEGDEDIEVRLGEWYPAN
ncbi:MBL fold metallo-hydrolase [Catalinimonas niigatensis]|uniref:MBL fold metallo-hydrolase n=1 Tax=Catalinimonas niigatensis TaxID=1397264 RepID=UPI00266584B6|nr:MBL fold metallo-hydrolase [Catalinimonas niigatensis]WPP49991.1 MBL fold metallo-hydrolase [Catalinimonas niigatensis]